MNKLEKVFKKKKNIIIGALHFPPLLGYTDYPGINVALENALKDLEAFEKGGVDAIIIENNYDIPHKANVDSSVVACLTYLGDRIKKNTKLPVGISILWNDYKSALSIAKVLGLKFIRIPVFVDRVETDYGIMEPQYKEVKNFQKKIDAEEVLLFTDIHVKHAKILSDDTIVQSAKKAIEFGSDSLIVTGKWTAQAPKLSELQSVRENVGEFPILLGSGVDDENVAELFKNANGAIVSTSLKFDTKSDDVNVKSYESRISKERVKELIDKIE